MFPLAVESPDQIPDRSLVGNKAHNLMVMSSLGIPVPKGFVVPVNGSVENIDIEPELYNVKYPVSVRSGSVVSMPGMMDTILNIGLNRDNLEFYSQSSNLSLETLYDSYARLIQMWGSVVEGIASKLFNEYEKAVKVFYFDLNLDAYKKLVECYEKVFKDEMGYDFPSSPSEQLLRASKAVKDSWWSQRAVDYRNAEGISHDLGTAVIVQEMVFGNMNDHSGTGVVFSHNPNNGNPGLYGDFLPYAQGEDIVSGSIIPQSIEDMLQNEKFKRCGKELKSYVSKLLREFKTIQDIEFTIQDGVLYLLQCRSAKCSRRALIRSALSMVNSGAMNIAEATNMVIDALPREPKKHISVDESSLKRVGFGQGVADGVAIGYAAFTHEDAIAFQKDNQPYIYCSELTSPNDNEVMRHAVGVLTSMGGRLSHAAVLARSMEKVTIVGFASMQINDTNITIDDIKVTTEDIIKIDGSTGCVYL